MGALMASMRPPLNAGENAVGFLPDTVHVRASMRPPLNAGENVFSLPLFRICAIQLQ